MLDMNWTCHSNLKLRSQQRHVRFVARVKYFNMDGASFVIEENQVNFF
jgi:hypothetical protein